MEIILKYYQRIELKKEKVKKSNTRIVSIWQACSTSTKIEWFPQREPPLESQQFALPTNVLSNRHICKVRITSKYNMYSDEENSLRYESFDVKW